MYDSRDTTWNPGRFASSELDSTWAWGATGQGDNRVVWTSLWPPVGSEAVVVSDSTESISLFARRVVGGWRFWSPIFTMSVAVFECDPPARILNPETLFSERGSWDGRIVPDSTVRKWLK